MYTGFHERSSCSLMPEDHRIYAIGRLHIQQQFPTFFTTMCNFTLPLANCKMSDVAFAIDHCFDITIMLTGFRDYLFEMSPNCIKLLVLHAEKEIYGWEQHTSWFICTISHQLVLETQFVKFFQCLTTKQERDGKSNLIRVDIF